MTKGERPQTQRGQSDFIAKIVTDPANPPETQVFTGYLGASDKEKHVRLYFDVTLAQHLDILQEDILHQVEVPESQMPLGGVMVWVKKEAKLEAGGPATRSKANWVEGQVTEAYQAQGLPDLRTAAPRTIFSQPFVCWTQSPVQCQSVYLHFCRSIVDACPTRLIHQCRSVYDICLTRNSPLCDDLQCFNRTQPVCYQTTVAGPFTPPIGTEWPTWGCPTSGFDQGVDVNPPIDQQLLAQQNLYVQNMRAQVGPEAMQAQAMNFAAPQIPMPAPGGIPGLPHVPQVPQGPVPFPPSSPMMGCPLPTLQQTRCSPYLCPQQTRFGLPCPPVTLPTVCLDVSQCGPCETRFDVYCPSRRPLCTIYFPQCGGTQTIQTAPVSRIDTCPTRLGCPSMYVCPSQFAICQTDPYQTIQTVINPQRQ